jgi:hypothetical protein
MADKKVGGYDLEGARKAEISDADSLKHLSQIHNYDLAGARTAGISDEESLSHLATLAAPKAEVYEKESPEFFGGAVGTIGAAGAAGDILFSKGRPLFRAAEKMFGMEDPNARVKPRVFSTPAEVAERAIQARMPQVDGGATENYMKSGQYISPEGKPLYYGAGDTGDYSGARKAAERAIETEKMFPGMKVLQGGTPIALPQDLTTQVETQRAEAQRMQDIKNQQEVNKAAEQRAQMLAERNRLKDIQQRGKILTGTGTIGTKVGAPILGGYQLGSQGAQAYNRLSRDDLQLSDVASGATNVVGAGMGASSMLPGRLRLPKAIASMGLSQLADVLDTRDPRKPKSVLEEKAAGGLAGYAKGKSVDEEKPFVGYPQIKRTNRNPNFKPQIDKYTGMLDALIGGSKREDLSVFDPKEMAYSEAYDKYEPAGIALMGAPFLGGPIKSLGRALAPKAGQAAEDLLARQGLISYAAPKAKMSPGLSFGNPAPIEAPMLRPSGSGSLLPKVSDPYIAHYQDILPQVRLKNPKPDSRMSRLESDPRAHQAIQDAIKAGVNIDPKLADWYGTNALLTGMLNEGRQFGNFEQFMKHMASSSQRNPVPQQNKMGSYLAYLENMGQIGDPGTKLALPKGYGSLAQGDIVNRSQRIAAGEYPFDDAIKLGKFYKSYMGYHPNNAVVDVIGTRVPTMATKDPDWLVSRLQIGTDAKGNKQIINPKAMYESGELSMEEALKRPGFWEAAPKLTGEYAGLEDMWKMGSKNAKQPYAGSGQALGWYGSAGLEDSAGLKSKPMTWVESLEKSARDRAAITGENPLDVMNKVLKGTGHFKEGGSTTPAWQRKEGKSPSGGLNALGRASYKRETGGELKAPQPEGGSRKKSFCARMGGMKKKLTSSETANDPDSRINKALRKWKC